MKAALSILLAGALLGQKAETPRADSSTVLRVETARDHLTVIELSDPVTMVAVGNRSAFTVERRENKVFLTPIDESARTNLFIWTSRGRYVYELVPAKDLDRMQFAVDQVAQPLTSLVAPPKPEVEAAQKTPPLPPEMLTLGQPVLLAGERETSGRAEVTIRDLYRKGNRVYLRYAVTNQSRVGYQPARPAAWRLDGATAYQSLLVLGGYQLGERLARTVRATTESLVELVDADQAGTIAAGNHGFGWLVIDDTGARAGDTVSVLRLEFAADARGPVEAYLVLQPPSPREVARVRPTGE